MENFKELVLKNSEVLFPALVLLVIALTLGVLIALRWAYQAKKRNRGYVTLRRVQSYLDMFYSPDQELEQRFATKAELKEETRDPLTLQGVQDHLDQNYHPTTALKKHFVGQVTFDERAKQLDRLATEVVLLHQRVPKRGKKEVSELPAPAKVPERGKKADSGAPPSGKPLNGKDSLRKYLRTVVELLYKHYRKPITDKIARTEAKLQALARPANGDQAGQADFQSGDQYVELRRELADLERARDHFDSVVRALDEINNRLEPEGDKVTKLLHQREAPTLVQDKREPATIVQDEVEKATLIRRSNSDPPAEADDDEPEYPSRTSHWND